MKTITAASAFKTAVNRLYKSLDVIPGFYFDDRPTFPISTDVAKSYMTGVVECEGQPLSIRENESEQEFKRSLKDAQRTIDNLARKVRATLNIDPSYKFRIATNKAGQIGKTMIDRELGRYFEEMLYNTFKGNPYAGNERGPLYVLQNVKLDNGLTLNWYIWFADPEVWRNRLAYFYFEFVGAPIKQKVFTPTTFPEVQVGSIFCDVWGYSMTIVDFYEVVQRPSENFVIVRKILSDEVKGDIYSPEGGAVVPVPHAFDSNGKLLRIKIQGWEGKPYLKSPQSGSMSLWNGKPVYECHWD